MNKKILMGVGLAASVFGAPGAFAQLDDKPYFNLWTNGVINDDLKGMATSIKLCGTSVCSSTATPQSPSQFAEFSVIHQQPAGSGYIDPFLRFQHNEGAANGSATTEAAYNTNYRDGSQGTGLIDGLATTTTNQAKDTKAGGDKRNFFNHAIRLGDLAVDLATNTVSFLLDINETGNPGVTLRLDELAFYVAASDEMNLYTADNSTGNQSPNGFLKDTTTGEVAKEVWNMDWNAFLPGGVTPNDVNAANPGTDTTTANGDKNKGYGGLNLANINDKGKAGSGDFDLQVKLDKQLFLNAANLIKDAAGNPLGDNAYVYLYNFAGRVGENRRDQDGTEADAGFEEWAAVLSTAPPPDNGVPEPSTALLLFGGLAGMLKIQRQRKASQTSA